RYQSLRLRLYRLVVGTARSSSASARNLDFAVCDGGGSNAAARYVFKFALEHLAERIGLEIRVAHYPPYNSKYNPIEHRFFPNVTRACQGLVFLAVEQVEQSMARTSTSTALKTTVRVLPRHYPTGDKAPKGYKS